MKMYLLCGSRKNRKEAKKIIYTVFIMCLIVIIRKASSSTMLKIDWKLKGKFE